MGAFYSRCAHRVATAAQGEAFFFDLRVEEMSICVGLLLVTVYCMAVYATVWTAIYPVRMVFFYGWDAALASLVMYVTSGKLAKRPPSKRAIEAMDPADQEAAKRLRKAHARANTTKRRLAIFTCVIVATVRYQCGSLRAALSLVS